jgi:hypothetical protein
MYFALKRSLKIIKVMFAYLNLATLGAAECIFDLTCGKRNERPQITNWCNIRAGQGCQQ